MSLKDYQKNVLSEFFLDVSKGLILGAFASQTFANLEDYSIRILYAIFHTLVALLFLWLALMYKQDAK